MSEASRAVGAVGQPSHRVILSRVEDVESRMDRVESAMVAARAETAAQNVQIHTLLTEIAERLGKPANGPEHPASGVYWVLGEVSARLTPFEQLWLQAKGAVKAIAILSLPVAALVWFLGGDKITHFFHG